MFFLLLHDHEMRVSVRIPVCSNFEAEEGEGGVGGEEGRGLKGKKPGAVLVYLLSCLSI